MKENCQCNYCKCKINEYFCLLCKYNFNECEVLHKFGGINLCPKCHPKKLKNENELGMKEKHEFTSDQKLKWWGYGEWVEEPDEVNFEHESFECKVLRMAAYEDPNGSMFGGHLCGYVFIPEGHILYGIDWDSNVIFDVHYGITYYGNHLFGKYCIGFDCMHYSDIIPSMEYLYNTIPAFKELREKERQRKIEMQKFFNFNENDFFTKTYKNINFVIEECKSLAEQVKNYKPEEAKNDTTHTI